ncbi:putative microsomal signal peptidase subunit SPCS1 domain-containing protein [Neospora caninum Liverpool]|uniref:Signal peptidase complex subunit 1 n=1 Tax=Neospora caninum (strain Liverpool) TaxID=572307 RepID=F0V8D5_NEOCL|nr:putative microsomal signal peptidase subunit SPCS1 domain-containing protein [Neospora caninum Liverpool]CBZ49976.1 putative microsomal signal peptidase subunit SPCS1 domain-containing protein [Neospora caninum Liverpool]CEL64564.1 TPA: microsomal signal peptidase subunit SPCS1 domain-containing protein, putative [Neospora caninum Liverpool]|eukprot:XP_003880011.1 putative microsomal signal peptidase subunit SPCS1 domain-containing protein [Neospora caninum Liverpool]
MAICSCVGSIYSAFAAVKSGVVDFKGQERVYSVLVYLAWAAGLIGFFVGGIFEDFSITIYTILICMALTAILCFPSWPMYNRHPVEWTPHDPDRLAALFTQQQQNQEGASHQEPSSGGKGRGKKHVESQRRK